MTEKFCKYNQSQIKEACKTLQEVEYQMNHWANYIVIVSDHNGDEIFVDTNTNKLEFAGLMERAKDLKMMNKHKKVNFK